MSSDGSRAARAVELGRRLVGLTPESGARGPCLRISPAPVVAAMTTLCARLVLNRTRRRTRLRPRPQLQTAGSIASPHTVQFIRLPPLWGYPLCRPSIRSGPRPPAPSPPRPSTSNTNPALNVTAQALDLDRPVEAPESCGRGIPPARPPPARTTRRPGRAPAGCSPPGQPPRNPPLQDLSRAGAPGPRSGGPAIRRDGQHPSPSSSSSSVHGSCRFGMRQKTLKGKCLISGLITRDCARRHAESYLTAC